MDVYVYAYMGYVGVPGMRIWDIWSHVYAYMGYTYMRIWDIWESREALGGFQACVLVGLFCVLVGLFCVLVKVREASHQRGLLLMCSLTLTNVFSYIY